MLGIETHVLENIVGSVAAFLTTVAFFPQVFKVLKTKDTRAISLPMYLIFATGVVLWLVYATMITSYPMLVGNTVTLICALIILAMKVRHG